MNHSDNKQPSLEQTSLEQVISALEPMIALMSLVQITGDRGLLRKYGPKLEGTQHQMREAFVAVDGEIDHDEADTSIVAEIREQLLQRVKSGQTPVMPHIDLGLFRDMARLTLGFDMPERSLEPAYQHAGFTTDTRIRQPKWPRPKT